MALYEFFTSRNNGANVATFVGQAGRLFYDGANGVIKMSDGSTPGGIFIPYNIATTSTIGGIKAGPGANVSVDGTLTIDTTGLPLSIGNLDIVDTTISTVVANEDLILATNGAGNVELVGNVHVHTTASFGSNAEPILRISNDGQVRILVPTEDSTTGAVAILGNGTGAYMSPIQTGVMAHITGQQTDASRIYVDAVDSYVVMTGRRYNGTPTSPTGVKAGNIIVRYGSNGLRSDGTWNTGGVARMEVNAIGDFSNTSQPSNIVFYTTAVNSTSPSPIVVLDNANGLTATKASVTGNLTVSGNVFAPRIIATGVRTISDGIYANLSFASDNIVHWYQPSGECTVNLNGYTTGATIRLLINMATARTINLGVSATNSTNGSTQLTAAKMTNNQAVQIVYTCIDGTSGNCHAALTYA